MNASLSETVLRKPNLTEKNTTKLGVVYKNSPNTYRKNDKRHIKIRHERKFTKKTKTQKTNENRLT